MKKILLIVCTLSLMFSNVCNDLNEDFQYSLKKVAMNEIEKLYDESNYYENNRQVDINTEYLKMSVFLTLMKDNFCDVKSLNWDWEQYYNEAANCKRAKLYNLDDQIDKRCEMLAWDAKGIGFRLSNADDFLRCKAKGGYWEFSKTSICQGEFEESYGIDEKDCDGKWFPPVEAGCYDLTDGLLLKEYECSGIVEMPSGVQQVLCEFEGKIEFLKINETIGNATLVEIDNDIVVLELNDKERTRLEFKITKY